MTTTISMLTQTKTMRKITAMMTDDDDDDDDYDNDGDDDDDDEVFASLPFKCGG